MQNIDTAIGFVVTYTHGRTDRIPVCGQDGYIDACAAVLAVYRSAEVGHDGGIPDGADCSLVWACAEDAMDDDGSHAVAKIVAVYSGDDAGEVRS